MRIAFVAGALESLDPSIDTTVGLMHAAQDRGADVWVTEAPQLEAVGGRARALARLVRLAPSKPAEGPFWTVDDTWFTVLATQRIWLDEMAAVFMRTDPALDGAFVTATLILDLVDASRTAMVNDPRGLRACSEHLLPLRYPDLTAPTIVTRDPQAIRSFLIQQGTAVVKPVDGFAGRGVLRLDRHDPNLPSLLEISTDAGSRSVVPRARFHVTVKTIKRQTYGRANFDLLRRPEPRTTASRSGPRWPRCHRGNARCCSCATGRTCRWSRWRSCSVALRAP